MIIPEKRNGTSLSGRNCPDIRDQARHSHATRVVIAANNRLTLQVLESTIEGWGYETMVVFDHRELADRMEQEVRPPLVILDGAMRDMDILSICRRIRLSSPAARPYIILLTPAADGQMLVDPSRGPDDLLGSPFTKKELRAHISTGMRILDLETELSELVVDLEHAASRIERLRGLLPICSHCKKIRDDRGYWNELERYISDHSDAEFSHAICPDCFSTYYPDVKDECL